jgi:hypothetical protein
MDSRVRRIGRGPVEVARFVLDVPSSEAIAE